MQPAHPMLVVMGTDDLRSLAKACPSCYRWRRVPLAVHVPCVKVNEIDRDGANYVRAVASPMQKPMFYTQRTGWFIRKTNSIITKWMGRCSFQHRARACLSDSRRFDESAVCYNIRARGPSRRSIPPSWKKLAQYLLWHNYLHIYRGTYPPSFVSIVKIQSNLQALI